MGDGLEAGWGRPLILVREGKGALPGGYIYHVAIRVPSREALGAFIKHVLADYPDHVDLNAAATFYRKLGMALTWKMPDAVFLAWGGYHHHVAFNRWPLPRPKGALAAAYTPVVSRPARYSLGVELLPAGENYQVRTILASAAYS